MQNIGIEDKVEERLLSLTFKPLVLVGLLLNNIVLINPFIESGQVVAHEKKK